MAGTGSRMERQQAFTPEPPRDLLSTDEHGYTDTAPVLQQAAARNPVLNGQDAEAWLGGSDG